MEIEKDFNKLYVDVCEIIEDARSYLAETANKTLTILYWKIGERINKDLLEGERAEYGKQIVSQLATKLSWSHFIELLAVKDDLQREFYLTMAINENWGRNLLRDKINGMLYERSLISDKPDKLIQLTTNN